MIKILFLCVYMRLCECVPCVCEVALGGPKSSSYHLELDLQAIVSSGVGHWEANLKLLEVQEGLLAAELTPQLLRDTLSSLRGTSHLGGEVSVYVGRMVLKCRAKNK